MIGFNTFSLAVIGKSADIFGITARDITTIARFRAVSWPRMAAAWALRESDPRRGSYYPIYSYHQLLRVFPWTDHTSAIHAIRKVRRLRESDPEFRAKTDQLLAFANEVRASSIIMVGGADDGDQE